MATKFILKLCICLIVGSLMTIIAGAPVSAATIVGSKHDFSTSPSDPPGLLRPFAGGFQVNADSTGYGMVIDEICVFCHTPHGASMDAQTNTLLWNRIPSNYTYKTYSSASMTNPAPDTADKKPTGISMMCMSCHDGVTSIAVNTLLNAPGRGNPAVSIDPLFGLDPPGAISNVYTPSTLGWGANIGNTLPGGTTIDLSNDHPISFDWPTGKQGLLVPTNLRLFGPNNRIECATCHKVHDPSIEPFLAMSNSQSLMCRSCHIK
jgi:hypothetical protein